MVDDVMRLVWERYRTWAATSRTAKAPLIKWRKVVLFLTVCGAVFGTISEQTRSLDFYMFVEKAPSVMCGLVSAISLALATYISRAQLGAEKEKFGVRARSAAEAFKSKAFMYATQIPPYDKENRGEILIDEIKFFMKKISDLKETVINAEERLKNIPKKHLTVDDYINVRVKEQKDKFYIPKSIEHNNIVVKSHQISFWLGAISAIFGAIAAVFPDGMTAGWVPVLSTLTVAVAAFFYAERHEQLALIYQATAARLDELLAGWSVKPEMKRDPVEFIKECENAISTENRSWMAKFVQVNR